MLTKQKFLAKLTTVGVTLGLLGSAVSSVHASAFTSMKDTMTRLKISTTADHTIVFTLPTGIDFDNSTQVDFLRIDFPATFSQSGTWVTGDFTFNDGTARTVDAVAQGTTTSDVSCTAGANNVGVAIDTDDHIFYIRPCGSTLFTASASAATITFTIDGTSSDGTLTNPASAASTVVSLAQCDETAACDSAFTSSHTGSFAVAIVDDDSVSVTASVDPSITFDLDTATTDTNSAAPYSVPLGTLSTGSVTTSNDSSINGIWVDLATNGGGGAVVTVVSANGTSGLVSTSTPADTIGSSTATLVAGTEGYGVCVTSSGTGAATASTGTLAAVAPFASTCTAAAHSVGGLTTSAQSILNSAGDALAGGRTEIRVKAAISATTEAHNDYADTLTFIATATF